MSSHRALTIGFCLILTTGPALAWDTHGPHQMHNQRGGAATISGSTYNRDTRDYRPSPAWSVPAPVYRERFIPYGRDYSDGDWYLDRPWRLERHTSDPRD